MCGFFVSFSLKNSINNFDIERFKQAAELIKHRGPDDCHSHFNQDIKMIFYRLSIIDLSKKGRQPMLSCSKNNIIVFNGEIYNARYLKSLLKKCNLKGNSDTEILINLYENYGSKILDKIEGMFSFIIYNFRTRQLFIARDKFGIKPLYYFKNSNYYLFASEIKPILFFLKKINFDKKGFADFFFKQEMDHGAQSFFLDIKSLEPASYAIISKSKEKKQSYWQINSSSSINNNYLKAKKEFKHLFIKSIDRHIVADTEISLLLSGGTDSLILASIINSKLDYKLKTFTYDFTTNKLGESTIANHISKKLNIENYCEIVDPAYVKNNFEKIIFSLESPFTSIRLFGQKKIYEKIKQMKIKVALDGSGGDEILGGYQYNYLNFFIDKIKHNPKYVKSFIDKILLQNGPDRVVDFLMTLSFQFGSLKDCTPYVYLNNFKKDFLKKYINEEFYFSEKFPKKINNLKRSQLIDILYVNLPRSLKYLDKLAMSESIENRVPYLDGDLAHYSFNLPNNFKIRTDATRYILKDVFKRDTNIIKKFVTKQKRSIVDPQRQWLKKELKEFVFDEFLSLKFKQHDIFDQKGIIKNYELFLKNNERTSFDIFQIFCAYKFQNLFDQRNLRNFPLF